MIGVAEAGASPALLFTQLGVGGVLVYFAAWAYRKIEESRDKLGQQNREDIEVLTERHEREVAELRLELRVTREQLIAALTAQNITKQEDSSS
jgi:hypothetical protein